MALQGLLFGLVLLLIALCMGPKRKRYYRVSDEDMKKYGGTRW